MQAIDHTNITLVLCGMHWTRYDHHRHLYRVSIVIMRETETGMPTGNLVIVPKNIMRTLELPKSWRDIRAWSSAEC
jgi:hypothetical protein